MKFDWLPASITIVRLHAIEISVNWRWLPVQLLCTYLLAQNVLPAHYPSWGFATIWLTSAASVLVGEFGLLLHELGHALLARGRGQDLIRIVFHGFRAETLVADRVRPPAEDALIALIGPAINLTLVVISQMMRLGLHTKGPFEVFLLAVILGNAAMAVMSLVPLRGSDGRRAVRALTQILEGHAWTLQAQVTGQGHNQDDHHQEAKRRPAGISPTARVAKATT